jgi:signal transduction histidine kinase
METWHRLAPLVRDSLGALLLLVLSLLPLGVPALQLGDLPSTVPAPVATVLTVIEVAPLALRRVAPSITLAVVGAAFAAAEITGAPTGMGGLALLIALYSVAAHQRNGRLIVAGASIVVYAALCFVLHLAGSPERVLDWCTFAAVLLLPWLFGEIMRRRDAVQAERLARAADDAVRVQRAALARELHDVVTHHVTAMVVQSESAPYLLPDDIAERDRVFSAVGETGRLALTELRTLLDTLDPDTIDRDEGVLTPEHDVIAMIGRLKKAGYPIELDAPADVRLPGDDRGSAVQTVVRVALTNAMKHARGATVSIRLRTTPLELRVANPISSTTRPISGGAGRGLAGMSSRVEGAGGRFEAGSVAGTTFVVSARWSS